jgi:hypothetical protein
MIRLQSSSENLTFTPSNKGLSSKALAAFLAPYSVANLTNAFL